MMKLEALARAPASYLAEVGLGEHNAHIAHQLVNDGCPCLAFPLLAVHADGALHHGVLAHEDDGLGAQGLKEGQKGVSGMRLGWT